MRRRIMPPALILLMIMLDTAVLPFLIDSPYVVCLTFITVLVLALYLGRMLGMLYGMIGGLLLDILVGYPLGFNTFLYIILGFLAGTVAYQPEGEVERERPSRLYLLRGLTLLGAVFVFELVVYGYQYFHTALLEGIYFLNIFIRTAFATAVGLLLGPVVARIVLGRPKKYQSTSAKREVKSF